MKLIIADSEFESLSKKAEDLTNELIDICNEFKKIIDNLDNDAIKDVKINNVFIERSTTLDSCIKQLKSVSKSIEKKNKGYIKDLDDSDKYLY